MESTSSLTTGTDEPSDRVCWVCLESELSEKQNDSWCHPCRCRGALKWVHHHCLQRWVDEQHAGQSTSVPVSCRVCGTQYEILYPEASPFYLLLEAMDTRTRVLSYYLTGGLVLGSLYWSAVTYGAITVMQVVGHRHGLRTMEQADPLLLLFGLPTIPVCLLLAKTIPWERGLRSLWRHYIRRWAVIRWLSSKASPTWPVREEAMEPGHEGYEFPRYFCSALALPTVASVTGRIFFRPVRSDFHKILLGGLTYLGIKGLLSVSYHEMRYTRACNRTVKDFEGEN
ncbi:E3 ubiquitin-protein ligase MARCH5 [Fasciola hepatica]|uniref:E3 ubiquitin-protein ligase MARCHF5 n=1 Tax=Fasciola hepatica TaxID=6192 RepID=A0A4E0R959_FASHE|nr:E3 ubiquitin-protein ligase MARCH5 [Fasciola hepatica]